MADEILNLQVSMDISMDGALDNVLKGYKSMQKEANNHTIIYNIGADDNQLKTILSKIQNLKPEILAGIKFDFNGTEYQNKIKQLQSYTDKSSKQIGDSLTTNVNTALKGVNTESIIKEFGSASKAINQLKQSTGKFDLSKATDASQIENQMTSLQKMMMLLKSAETDSKINLGNNIDISNLKNSVDSQIKALQSSMGDAVKSNAGAWITQLESQLDTGKSKALEFVNQIQNMFAGAKIGGTNGITQSITEITQSLEQLSGDITTTEEKINQLKSLSSKSQNGIINVDGTTKSLEEVNGEISTLQNKLTGLQEQKANLENALSSKKTIGYDGNPVEISTTPIVNVLDWETSIQKQIDSKNVTAQVKVNPNVNTDKNPDDTNTLDAQTKQLDSLNAKAKDYETSINKLKEEITQLKADNDALQKVNIFTPEELTNIETALNTLKEALDIKQSIDTADKNNAQTLQTQLETIQEQQRILSEFIQGKDNKVPIELSTDIEKFLSNITALYKTTPVEILVTPTLANGAKLSYEGSITETANNNNNNQETENIVKNNKFAGLSYVELKKQILAYNDAMTSDIDYKSVNAHMEETRQKIETTYNTVDKLKAKIAELNGKLTSVKETKNNSLDTNQAQYSTSLKMYVDEMMKLSGLDLDKVLIGSNSQERYNAMSQICEMAKSATSQVDGLAKNLRLATQEFAKMGTTASKTEIAEAQALEVFHDSQEKILTQKGTANKQKVSNATKAYVNYREAGGTEGLDYFTKEETLVNEVRQAVEALGVSTEKVKAELNTVTGNASKPVDSNNNTENKTVNLNPSVDVNAFTQTANELLSNINLTKTVQLSSSLDNKNVDKINNILNTSYGTNNKDVSTAQLKETFNNYKTYLADTEALNSQAGQESAFAYLNAYQDALKNNINKNTLKANTADGLTAENLTAKIEETKQALEEFKNVQVDDNLSKTFTSMSSSVDTITSNIDNLITRVEELAGLDVKNLKNVLSAVASGEIVLDSIKKNNQSKNNTAIKEQITLYNQLSDVKSDIYAIDLRSAEKKSKSTDIVDRNVLLEKQNSITEKITQSTESLNAIRTSATDETTKALLTQLDEKIQTSKNTETLLSQKIAEAKAFTQNKENTTQQKADIKETDSSYTKELKLQDTLYQKKTALLTADEKDKKAIDERIISLQKEIKAQQQLRLNKTTDKTSTSNYNTHIDDLEKTYNQTKAVYDYIASLKELGIVESQIKDYEIKSDSSTKNTTYSQRKQNANNIDYNEYNDLSEKQKQLSQEVSAQESAIGDILNNNILLQTKFNDEVEKAKSDLDITRDNLAKQQVVSDFDSTGQYEELNKLYDSLIEKRKEIHNIQVNDVFNDTTTDTSSLLEDEKTLTNDISNKTAEIALNIKKDSDAETEFVSKINKANNALKSNSNNNDNELKSVKYYQQEIDLINQRKQLQIDAINAEKSGNDKLLAQIKEKIEEENQLIQMAKNEREVWSSKHNAYDSTQGNTALTQALQLEQEAIQTVKDNIKSEKDKVTQANTDTIDTLIDKYKEAIELKKKIRDIDIAQIKGTDSGIADNQDELKKQLEIITSENGHISELEAKINVEKEKGLLTDEQSAKLAKEQLNYKQQTSNIINQINSSENQRKLLIDKNNNRYNTYSEINPSDYINADEVNTVKNKMETLYNSIHDGSDNSILSIKRLNQKLEEQFAILKSYSSKQGTLVSGNNPLGVNIDSIKQQTQQLKQMIAESFNVGVNKVQIGNISTFGKNISSATATVKTASNEIANLRVNVDGLTGDVITNGTAFTKTQTAMGKWITGVQSKFADLTQYFSGLMMVMKVMSAVQDGFNIIKDIDTQITEMAKVSNETTESLNNYAQACRSVAKEIGTTNTSLLSSTASWMRLGKSIDQASELAKNTTILMNVSEFESIDDATESMVSLTQAYQDMDSMDIIDKINKIGKNIA